MAEHRGPQGGTGAVRPDVTGPHGLTAEKLAEAIAPFLIDRIADAVVEGLRRQRQQDLEERAAIYRDIYSRGVIAAPGEAPPEGG